MTETVYQRLMSGVGLGEHGDRHTFACLISVARSDPAQSSGGALTHALGLSPDAFISLLERYFPTAAEVFADLAPSAIRAAHTACDEDDGGALEEEDLRRLLMGFRAGKHEEELWLTAIIAHRSLYENHLWQDLGFRNRDELNAMLSRHFPAMVKANAENMKWKKFFYRQMCQMDGVLVCKSPNCETCSDHAICFGEESGEPLLFRAPSGGATTPTA
jgi:nitrogen fixation protein NifQ